MTARAAARCLRFTLQALALGLTIGAAHAAQLDPAAVIYQLPDQIKWTDSGVGAKNAVLMGDPSKPGLYAVMVKWLPGNFSRPHFHPNDRFITVLKGTWWVGTGTKFDVSQTVAMPAGSFVTHFGKQVHWDGAKDEEAVLLIMGEGPATSTRVPFEEVK
jgi:quercetin dioxygenase-like cupin family protein